MGLFSKGQSALSPAQVQMMQLAQQAQDTFRKKWQPVQEYYASQLETNAPGMQALAEGRGAGTAQARGTAATLNRMQRDAQAGVGSGKFVSGLGAGLDTTAGAAGLGQTEGGLTAQQAYLQGLTKVLGLGQTDQATALQGLQTAAGTQAAEAGQQTQQNIGTQQGIGQLIGLGGALGGAFKGTPALNPTPGGTQNFTNPVGNLSYGLGYGSPTGNQ